MPRSYNAGLTEKVKDIPNDFGGQGIDLCHMCHNPTRDHLKTFCNQPSCCNDRDSHYKIPPGTKRRRYR